MCAWGDNVPVVVKIASHLSHTGCPRWRAIGIDRCLAPLVARLQAAGVDMLASCCGHGRGDGEILLADGGRVVVRSGEIL